MTFADRTDHTDDPAPPRLTNEQAVIAHLNRQIAALVDRLVEKDRADSERFSRLEQENAALREDVEKLKTYLPWRRRQQ